MDPLPICIMDIEKPVIEKLSELNIKYSIIRHEPIFGSSEREKISPDPSVQDIKSIFVNDKNNHHYVVSTLTLLAKQFNLNKIRFGSPENMLLYLGVKPGSVTPLASINDKSHSIQFILDATLKKSSNLVSVHPLHNEASVVLQLNDLIRYINSTGHDVLWFNSDDKDEKHVENSKQFDVAQTKANSCGNSENLAHLGMTFKKNENFSEWYSQIIVESGMIEYYDISGCYILRPWAYSIWESIQTFLNSKFSELGVQNTYFPLFVTKQKLEAEESHIDGFKPEVAWVTKSGNTDLPEPIALRPTSETIMYPFFSKWIRSHRDLPLKLNQWCQVVRWEFKQPTPFIRSREFLWQEGHTAHATLQEAKDFTFKILDIYESVYKDILAIPVIKGIKSIGEKFAGANMTTTVEAFIPANGRAIQAATSHFLGTNFSKIFDVTYEDMDKKKQLAYQTSWGISTRALGIMVMIHSDDKGLVLPPPVAPIQVVIIPIVYKNNQKEVLDKCYDIENTLKMINIRVTTDTRNYTPGWKYNDWELKGACLRIELGPRNITNCNVDIIRRDNNNKTSVGWDMISATIQHLLKTMHESMYTKAYDNLQNSIVQISNWESVSEILDNKKILLAPWKESLESEKLIKEKTTKINKNNTDLDENNAASLLTGGMKSLCFPLLQPTVQDPLKCFFSGDSCNQFCLFGRSY